MVISPQVVIKRGPEHPTLAEYLADNPSPACPILGLDHITEFWPVPGVCSELCRRPYYHCSVGECFNEQGNSRQMMQHLVRRHHVEGWLKEKGRSVPDNIKALVAVCKQMTGDSLDMGSLKVIVSKDLWQRCKKTRLRLGQREAQDLYRTENMKNTDRSTSSAAGLGGKERIAVGVGGGLEYASIGSPIRVINPSEIVETACVVPPSVSSPSLETSAPVVIAPIKPAAPDVLVYPTPSRGVQATPAEIVCPKCNQKIAVDKVRNHNLLKHNLPCKLCQFRFTTLKELEEHILSVHPEYASSYKPSAGGDSQADISLATIELSDFDSNVHPQPAIGEQGNVTELLVEKFSEKDKDSLPDIALACLKLSDIDSNVHAEPVLGEKVDVGEILVSNVSEEDKYSSPKFTDVRSEGNHLPDLLSISNINTSSVKVPPKPSGEGGVLLPPEIEEIIDLTGQQKKLSLKDYQEKLRRERNVTAPQEDVKPFEEDDEVEVVGMKEGNAKTSRVGTTETLFKKEKLSTAEPKDLLDRRSSGDVVVEGSVKAPPPDPMKAFMYKVTDRVRHHLLNYYAMDAKDRKRKDGTLKEIKIRDKQDFENHCRNFSKKFRAEIYDAYTTINGGDEGIDLADVREYGIGHDIDKFFTDIKKI